MIILDSIAAMQQQARDWRRAGEQIVFVPTMGNLHAGHIALVEAARSQAEHCVVSIFVNPGQFGPEEDFATYPRSFDADCGKLKAAGVDCVFAPSTEAMYPEGKDACTSIMVPGISDVLEGEHRPGFFTGVATVVNKLFNCVRPDIAIFGEKDFQQCLVIQRMVRDLDLSVKIVTLPTVREADGLALSSRNAYLNAEQRQIAVRLSICLGRLVAAIHQPGEINFAVIHASQELEQQGFEVDYVVIRRQRDLQVPAASDTALVALAAVRLGAIRLIDNVPFILENA